MRSSALIIPAAALVLALAGCGGGTPTPAPTVAAPVVTPDPGPSSTPTEAADEDHLAEIVVSATGVSFVSEHGARLGQFHYTQSPEEIVPLVSGLLGVEAGESDSTGGLETAPSHNYDWAGFVLVDPEGSTIMLTDVTVKVTAATVAGVPISTVGDLQVGDPMSSAVAIDDQHQGFPNWAAIGSRPIDAASVGEAAGADLAIYVGVSGHSTIESFVAPAPNWGV